MNDDKRDKKFSEYSIKEYVFLSASITSTFILALNIEQIRISNDMPNAHYTQWINHSLAIVQTFKMIYHYYSMAFAHQQRTKKNQKSMHTLNNDNRHLSITLINVKLKNWEITICGNKRHRKTFYSKFKIFNHWWNK